MGLHRGWQKTERFSNMAFRLRPLCLRSFPISSEADMRFVCVCTGWMFAALASAEAQSTDAQSALRPLVASLQPTNNAGDRIFGSVKLTPNGSDGYKAEVQIRNGGGAQNKFPWVIRPGACGSDTQDVLGNELAYRVLETISDGTARLNAPLKLVIPDGTFHVNVLKGVRSVDRETVVACGVLSVTT
jgi:hypothetical protein